MGINEKHCLCEGVIVPTAFCGAEAYIQRPAVMHWFTAANWRRRKYCKLNKMGRKISKRTQ